MENIIIYTDRIKGEANGFKYTKTEEDFMMYCVEEWNNFIDTYPNPSDKIIEEVKNILQYDKSSIFFNTEEENNRIKEKHFAELKLSALTEVQSKSKSIIIGGSLALLYISYCFFLLFTKWEFSFFYHIPMWLVILFVCGYIPTENDENVKELFEQKKKEFGYVD